MNKNLNVKEITKKHFEDSAQTYNTSHDGQFVKCMYDEIFDRVTKANPKKVLDLGCGNGNMLKLLHEKTNTKLYGLDLSKNMIKECKKRLNETVKLTVGDSEKLPYEDNSFDLIICNASFHHYPNPEIVLNEIKRVLCQNGILILGDPTIPFNFALKIFNLLLKYSDSGDYKLYNKKSISTLLTKCGFKVTDFKKINYRTFTLNAVNIK